MYIKKVKDKTFGYILLTDSDNSGSRSKKLSHRAETFAGEKRDDSSYKRM